MSSVYIATSLSNQKNHNLLRDELKKHGIRVSYDWTVKDLDSDRADRAYCELSGVKYADLVVVLLPGGRGTHVEFGYALALNKPIIVHGPDEAIHGVSNPAANVHECIFWALENQDIIRVPATYRGLWYGGQECAFGEDAERLAALVAQRVTITRNMGLQKGDNDHGNDRGSWLEL